MNRCLKAHKDHPGEGYSPVAFFVATKAYSAYYAGRCNCASGPCEDHTDRTHYTDKIDPRYIAYRIYDTRDPPTLKPTPAPKLYSYMNYSLIGYGQCKKYKYLLGQVSVSSYDSRCKATHIYIVPSFCLCCTASAELPPGFPFEYT